MKIVGYRSKFEVTKTLHTSCSQARYGICEYFGDSKHVIKEMVIYMIYIEHVLHTKSAEFSNVVMNQYQILELGHQLNASTCSSNWSNYVLASYGTS